MKKKYIYIIGIILFVVVLTLVIFRNKIFHKKNTVPIIHKVEKNETNSSFMENKLDFTSQTLYNYGKEIYDKKEYTKYKKNESGVYIITYGDLINEGYNLKFLGEGCLDESVIIQIDADFKLKQNYYNDYPIHFTKACLTKEKKEKIEQARKEMEKANAE
jgi:hypothetical protein